MEDKRERGVMASVEGLKKLKAAQASGLGNDEKSWTQAEIANKTGFDERTVGRFLRREQKVDESSARLICQVLGVVFEEAIEVDRTGQIRENPFIYGTPVPPEKFYGRQREMGEVRDRIGSRVAQSINIVGFRRIGKTSLLHYIKGRPGEFVGAEYQPLIVSLDLSDSRFHRPEGITEGLRRGILEEQRGKEPWRASENENPWAVVDGLEALRDRGARLIVLLDEFEAIATPGRVELFQGWGEDWRSKASAGLLTLVVASKRPIGEVYQELGLTSPFGNIFSKTVLGVLEGADWHRLVRDGFAGGKVDDVTMEWIDGLAGGWPFYVQMAGSLLWQEKSMEMAERRFRSETTERFAELWRNLSGAEQDCVQQLLSDRGSDGLTVNVSALQAYGVLQLDRKLFSQVLATTWQRKK
jgi:transcriptional regulator with XRE-family HTH domain